MYTKLSMFVVEFFPFCVTIGTKPPNTACTRRVGVAAFSGSLRGLKLVPANSVLSSRPPAGNASRWVAHTKMTKNENKHLSGMDKVKMIRKLLVRIIACFYLAQGLWAIGTFFSPIFMSPRGATLELSTILGGALGLWAAIYLFKLDEFGRKFAIILLSLRVAGNLAFVVWSLFQEDLTFALTYFGTMFFKAESVYPLVIYLMAWAGMALAALLFLMQKETKVIFVSETTNEERSKPSTKSISNP
jgi:hypothetical protein